MAENKPVMEKPATSVEPTMPRETTYDRAQRLARTLPGKKHAATPADIEHYVPEAEKQLVEEHNEPKNKKFSN